MGYICCRSVGFLVVIPFKKTSLFLNVYIIYKFAAFIVIPWNKSQNSFLRAEFQMESYDGIMSINRG